MNIRGVRAALILVFIFVSAFQISAQDKDFQNWNEFTLEKKVSKKLSILLGEEFRFVNNATQFDKLNSSVGGDYSFNKYIGIGVFYRYTFSRDIEDGNSQKHRIYTDLKLSYKFHRITASYRGRYQNQTTTAFHDQEGISNEQYLRNRIKIKYNVPKIPATPYVEAEYYYCLNNPYGRFIDRSRYTFGADYSLSKDFSVGLYYRVQIRRESFNKPLNSYILGTTFDYKF